MSVPDDLRGFDRYGCLLHQEWVPVPGKPSVVRGFWAEDMSDYEFEMPSQLRDCMIEMQNWLSRMYKQLQDSRHHTNNIENFGKQIFPGRLRNDEPTDPDAQ